MFHESPIITNYNNYFSLIYDYYFSFRPGIRTINTLSQAALTLEANPHLIDKHKGKVLKQQRNIVIGTAGIVLFFILWRVNKIVSSYEGMVKVESAPASPVAASATAPASAVTAGNSSTFAPSAPTKSAIENSDARDTLTKRAAAKSANLKKID